MTDIISQSECTDITFTGLVHNQESFTDLEFINCKFVKCDFSESSFSDCTFENCYFENTNLSNCKLNNTRLVTPKFKSSKLLGIDFTLVSTSLGLVFDCELSDLSYCSFIDLDIRGSKFLGCKMNEVDFTLSNISNSSFVHPEFYKAIFSRTNMEKCDFRNAKDYAFIISENRCRDAIFSYNGAMSLLSAYGIRVE